MVTQTQRNIYATWRGVIAACNRVDRLARVDALRRTLARRDGWAHWRLEGELTTEHKRLTEGQK